MSGVPLETVVRLLERAGAEYGEELYVSEMQPGALLYLHEPDDGPKIGEIRCRTEEIVWFDTPQ